MFVINIENLKKLKCCHEHKKIFKEEELTIQKSIRKYMTMSEENRKQTFGFFFKIDKIRKPLIEEINRHELMSTKHKNVCNVFS